MTEAAGWGECGARHTDSWRVYDRFDWDQQLDCKLFRPRDSICSWHIKSELRSFHFFGACETVTVTCCWILNLPGEIKESHTGFNEAMMTLLIYKGWGWRYSTFYWFSWKDQTKPINNCLHTQSLTQCISPVDLYCVQKLLNRFYVFKCVYRSLGVLLCILIFKAFCGSRRSCM